jgi:hypothetical protein
MTKQTDKTTPSPPRLQKLKEPLDDVKVKSKPSRVQAREQPKMNLRERAKELRAKKKHATGLDQTNHTSRYAESQCRKNQEGVNQRKNEQEPKEDAVDHDTWTLKVALTALKLQTSTRSLLGEDAGSKKQPPPVFRNKEHQAQVERALGDILAERILEMDPTLLQTVPAEDWEALLALPANIMQDILWNIECHEERGLVFGWKAIQIMVLSHTLGLQVEPPCIGGLE